MKKRDVGMNTYSGTIDERDYIEFFEELTHNPDFSYLGTYDSYESMMDELMYQGFTYDEIVFLTNARYGNVIEIIEQTAIDKYDVFIGAY